MQSRIRIIQALAAAFLFALALPASAKPVTINDITIDLPASFRASDYSRGIETKTPDDEVYVWFETYLKGEADTLIAEHGKYWKENDVAFPSAATERKIKSGDIDIKSLDFKDATWKGKQTVVRYLEMGPLGAKAEMVLVTVWASPEGINAHGKDVEAMIDSMNVKIRN